jgi:hypothetical protein
MSEETTNSESASETARSEAISRPPAKGRNVLLMVAAIVIVIALIATAFVVMPKKKEKAELTATIKGDVLEVDAGASKNLTVVAMFGTKDVTNDTSTTTLFWSVTPSSTGSFAYKARSEVPFKAAIQAGTGTVTCSVKYKETPESDEIMVVAEKSITILPPYLDSVSVSPVSKTIQPGGNWTFVATAVSSVGLPISGANFAWSIAVDPGVTCTLNVTTGPSIRLDVGSVLGNATLTATGSYVGRSKIGNASIVVGYLPPRSIDYVWYDMFNVPTGSWYDVRYKVYQQEERITDSYPWLFYYHSDPTGNLYLYSLLRLNITGRNVSEVNTNGRPEFLPMLSPTERGGTIWIDWYMQYLTSDELDSRYSSFASQDDGWIVVLNGTVTLDKQAAKMVLNITEDGLATFDRWWSENQAVVNQRYSEFLIDEFARTNAWNAYESYYQLFALTLDASKVGDKVVLRYDLVTWGMETLMLRWLHECFLPVEMWYEDMHFHMIIMPEWATIDIDTAVTYALYAYETIDSMGKDEAEPCWVFQPLLGDAIESSIDHPVSIFDKYADQAYLNRQPDSTLYGTYMPYDIVPAAWNLSENETLKIKWPAGNQTFRYRVDQGVAINITDEIAVRYSEPMNTDFTGKITVNDTAKEVEFVGPMDMYDWSKTQIAHSFLSDEWNRLGGSLLPYGMPWVEFETKNPVRIYLDHFEVTAQNSAPANDDVTVTVRAINNYGSTYYRYNGTVNFTCTDTASSLPANYTFKLADKGTHTFVGGVEFQTLGMQNITVTNVTTTIPAEFGNKSVMVLPIRNASSMQVDVYYVPAVGVPENVTVTVYDQYGAVFLNYTGTVTFSSNRTAGVDVTLPPDYTFVLGDAGVHKIVDSLTFNADGMFCVNASDTANASVMGSQSDITVFDNPEVIGHFDVTGIRNMLGKQRSDVSVTAYDQYGRVFKRYNGTVHFSANASGGVFPADYTFLVADQGLKLFVKGVSFTVSQDTVYNVTVADTVVTTATGSQTGILITYKPASETIRMYDFFQEPFGEWWYWRWPGYGTDVIINNEPGKYSFLYTADGTGGVGIIYAPYRWNITGTNLSQISVHNPEFMPVLGTPNVPGARADVAIYFEYLSWNWWNNYWVPVWHMPSAAMDAQIIDGYYPGVTYNITMNRAAAEEWLGMPQTANPLNWWNLNGQNFINKWEAWILNEGNNRLNVWPGYEWPYISMGTKMVLSVKPNGDIFLRIGHLGEGYEILMTRWLNETNICNHEAYYEDMLINVKYYSDWIDLQFDAAVQYSLRAVKANESATNEGAWAWDPLLIDYVPTWETPGGTMKSKFDPWAYLTYLSYNAGDPSFGYEVPYDSGVAYFNLTDYQTFVIQLPTGNDNLGYLAEPMPWDSLVRVIMSGYPGSPPGNPPAPDSYDYSAYWPLMYNGTMTLGYYVSGGVDIRSMFNPVTNTITMKGPLNFDNAHQSNGALYRGAPWIEFNVTIGTGPTSLPNPPVQAPPTGFATEPAATTITADMIVVLSLAAAAMVVIATIAVISRRKD